MVAKNSQVIMRASLPTENINVYNHALENNSLLRMLIQLSLNQCSMLKLNHSLPVWRADINIKIMFQACPKFLFIDNNLRKNCAYQRFNEWIKSINNNSANNIFL